MKQMSYFYTMEPFLARRKDITRRVKCGFLPGEHYQAVDRMQGLKKGQKRAILGECACCSNIPEKVEEIIKRPVRKCVTVGEWERARLCCRYFHQRYYDVPNGCRNPGCIGYFCNFSTCMGIHEVDREGFPEYTPEQFAEMLCKMNHITHRDIIQRVVFRRIS